MIKIFISEPPPTWRGCGNCGSTTAPTRPAPALALLSRFTSRPGIFLAPSGAQGVLMSVCLSLWLKVHSNSQFSSFWQRSSSCSRPRVLSELSQLSYFSLSSLSLLLMIILTLFWFRVRKSSSRAKGEGGRPLTSRPSERSSHSDQVQREASHHYHLSLSLLSCNNDDFFISGCAQC